MAANDLVTFANAQSYLDLDDSDSTLAGFLITSISKYVQNLTGRDIVETAYTEYLDGDGHTQILLKQYPATAVTSIHLDAGHTFGSASALDTDDYYLNEETGIIDLYNTGTPRGYKTVKVVYTAGYSTIPEDLQQAVFEALAWNMKRFSPGSALIGTKTLSVPDGMNTTYEIQVPLNARQVFESYGDKRV